jgi:hypothetical protein
MCGFTLAACSASVPSLDFLKSAPSTAALRFESTPPGAVVKVSGQTCRTPCELTLEVAEVSATFTRKGYQPQTIPVKSEGGIFSTPGFAPNPVHADLQSVVASKRTRAKVAGADTDPSATADATYSNMPEPTAPGTGTGWSVGDVK